MMTALGLFVGRDEELARFAEAAERVRLFLIYGPAGVGKTALASLATEQLARRIGGRRLHHVCRPGESLSTIASALLGRTPSQRESGVAQFARAAGESPVVVCLDDVHKAGEPPLSAQIIELASCGHSVWVCITSREALPLSPTQVDHLVLRLTGLSTEAARSLWTSLERLYGPPGLSFDEALGRTGGSPLLLKQAFAGPLDPVPFDPLEIQRLQPQDRELLREIAAFRRAPALSLIAEGRSEPDTRASVERLARRFMIELDPAGGIVMHDLVREALLAVDPPGPAEHRRCLELLAERAGTNPIDVLHHAVRCGDDDRALVVLRLHTTPIARVKPRDSVADRELLSALELFASRHPLDAPLRLLRARIRARLGELAEAHAEFVALAESEDPQVQLDAGELELYTGAFDSAAQRLRRAATDPRMDLVTRIWARVLWIETLKEQGAFDEAVGVLADGAADPEAVGSLGKGLGAFLAAFIARDRGQYEAAERSIHLAAELLDRFVAELGGVELPTLPAAFIPRLVSSTRALGGLVRAAAGHSPERPIERDPFFNDALIFQLHGRMLSAETLLLRGDAKEAAAIASEAASAAARFGLVPLGAWASYVRGRAMLALGRVHEVFASIETQMGAAEKIGLSGIALKLRAVLAAAQIDRGESEAGAAIVRGANRSWGASHPGAAAWLAALAALAEAASGGCPTPRSPKAAEGHDRADAELDRVEALLYLGQPDKAQALAVAIAKQADLASWQYLACRARGLEIEAAFAIGDFARAEAAWGLVRERAERAGYATLQMRAELIGAALSRLHGELREAEAAALAYPKGLAARMGLLDPIVARLRGAEHELQLTERQAAAVCRDETSPLIDLPHGRVRISGQTTDLSRHPTLLSVLAALACPAGGIVAIDQLVQKVWGVEYHPLRHRSRLVMSIARLRELLGAKTIEAREGGYRLALEGCRVLDVPVSGF